ncbi:hypothetical protein CapIbe_022230 [Capra ibex]
MQCESRSPALAEGHLRLWAAVHTAGRRFPSFSSSYSCQLTPHSLPRGWGLASVPKACHIPTVKCQV